MMDQHPKPSREKILLACFLAVVLGPFVFFNGCLFLGAVTQMAIDRSNGPLRLTSAVSATAPDRKTKFEAQVDGTARLIKVATGQVLHSNQISVDDYRSVAVVWKNAQQVEVTCEIRYPAMAHHSAYLWDRRTGVITDTLSGPVQSFAR